MKDLSNEEAPRSGALGRRDFLKVGGAAGAGLLLGSPRVWSQEQSDRTPPEKPRTNVDEALKVPRTDASLPGRYPGRVVEIRDPASLVEDRFDGEVIASMFEKGITALTGTDLAASFPLFFTPEDVVGIKVNPVGPGLISTRLEVVDAIVAWLVAGGIDRGNIVIWDRFEAMLAEAGFTSERYPGLRIEALQTMDYAAAAGETDDDSGWLGPDGRHVSAERFDPDVVYWADVEGPDDKAYWNQQVFKDKRSPFGKLVTRRLTKIVNVPVLKNTGNGISVATKNLGYGAICNTGRLHKPLFFDVCTEVLAFPCIRDKLVLNVTDGLRAQFEGGPMPAADFAYPFHTLFFATDPFASDRICHDLLVEKRKSAGIQVNEHPMFTEYLRYAEKLGLGIAEPERIEHVCG
ncbi:MAG: DUF362 domain-containing protein [Candidatus Eisenbacteria bacterium]|nr:DUF362 domain-containing protein [Candidatus Latescibacterota bacterium]MBD3301257.1 DUF362 domain-containing protein [Candidatus Eisenbacteria bacterium]